MEKVSPPRRKRTQRDYTLGFKLAVVEQVEKGYMTYKQARRDYGVQGRSTLLVWLRKHGSLDWSPLMLQAMTSPTETPEQVFVSDITYVESGQGVHYLSLVTDAGSRKIMGHELSREIKAGDVVKALQQAVRQRCHKIPLIHHSDRGIQYCSRCYQDELGRHGIEASITDGHDCYQNALA